MLQKATILLDDGTKWEGAALGVPGAAVGSLCLYTGDDYMETITDPSSAGQICAFTMPTIGAWGVNTEHCETGKPWIRGIITRDICHIPSNWRSAETLEYYLRRNVVVGVTDVDTDALQRYAIEKDIQKCAVVTSAGFAGWDALLTQIKSFRYDNTFPNAVKAQETYGPVRGVIAHVALCDFGASYGLVRLLNSLRIRTTLLPPYDAATILMRGGFDGLVLPHGPGCPRNHPGITQALSAVIDAGIPMMGFGLGAQFIAAAYGVRLQRMTPPRRGAWFPVLEEKSGMTFYTRQYHEQSLGDQLPDGLAATYRSALDNAVEGFRVTGKPIAGYQFLPFGDVRLGGTGEMIKTLFALLKGE